VKFRQPDLRPFAQGVKARTYAESQTRPASCGRRFA
jgi:hypothetical protein